MKVDKTKSTGKENACVTDRLEGKLDECHDELDYLHGRLHQVSDQNYELKEQLLTVQCKSLENNLIFTGIDETEEENVEVKAQNVIENNLKIAKSIELEKVHRLGKKRSDQTKPRPILVAFTSKRDRDIVKSQSHKLKGSSVGINEHFPYEIQQRRNQPWHRYKQAKSNGHKTSFIRDRLYIDGKRIYPDSTPDIDPNVDFPALHSDREPPHPYPQQTREESQVQF
ncbi:protein unc-13 homolog C-like [Haliotis cracherodii]|uniref:protein unc-13 homolog C-like n=1 Tax=Haliotis cracherodii TaxID=6455 RepID=UPI0039E76F70